jgi:hypothetical protein
MTNTMLGVSKTFIQEDTSVNPYRLVKLGTNADEVVAATGDTDILFGISDESANATTGAECNIILGGVAKLSIAATTTKGAYITATTAGEGAETTTDKKTAIGILLETTTETHQIAQVLIAPQQLSV